jgi:uncharacterized protein YtpQ (UPF0354 family)
MSLFKRLFRKPPQVGIDNSTIESIIETHRNKIYPWVKVYFADDDPRNTPNQIEVTGEDSPIIRKWLGDLRILYVADMGNSFQVVLERDLPKNMKTEELHQLAVDNLNRDIEFKLYDTNFGGHGLIAGGDHEAGSICLPGMWDWLTEHLNDDLIVGIPAKDLVILVPESDSDKIVNLKIFVHEMFKNGERLLTKNIFRYDRQTKEWTIVDCVT